MEDLNKTQMVLLCLLVSFVTSIGTGIITTSLLREVPQNVTQTINRVVERTVETVAPQVTTNTNTVTREVTVVVKEEDLVIDSIKKSRASLVRIMKSSGSGSSATQVVQAIGVIVKSDGTILTDGRSIDDTSAYTVVMPTGESYAYKISTTNDTSSHAFLTPTLKDGQVKTFTPITVSANENPQLGQTVIAVGGKDKEAVAIGRVNSLGTQDVGGSSNASSTKIVSIIETDTPLRDQTPGSILLNLNGEMIGFENFERLTGQEDTYNSVGIIRREKPAFFQ